MQGEDFSQVKSGRITSGENKSFWIDTSKPQVFSPIGSAVETDVLIIGGGIAGLTTAYLLAKNKVNVVLVEDGAIGSGESGRTTAHITHALDDRYSNIEKIYGEEGARTAAESHTAAIEKIRAIVKEEKIKCDLETVDGYLFLHPSDKLKTLEDEFKATQKAGLPTEWMEKVPGIRAQGPCIRFPNQSQFHIMPYLHGLAKAVVREGGKIFTNTHAKEVGKHGAHCNGHEVKAKHIVVATNSPVNDLVTMHTKQMPFRTYVIAALIKRSSLERSLWWDTGDQDSKWYTAPYHYVRTAPYDDTHDVLISGGEDHKTGQADDEHIPEEDRYAALIAWTKEHFPQMGEVINQWSGQVLEPLDYMGFIGKNPGNDNVYIITGDSGNGMTHGTLGGIIIASLIQDDYHPWAGLYSPKRIPINFPGKFMKEALNMAVQYGDYLKKADIKETDELRAGSGAILGKGLKRYAVYKDGNGAVHAFTAVCPHLGCVVQWNEDEKTFDCPCHGSRFSKEGVVINGPATNNLEKLRLEE